jgi:flagellar hook-associated protein 1 FlgK
VSDLFHALSLAARSLDAQRFGLDVTGQNIANVNTPGYSRRSIVFSEVAPHDALSAGGGVDVQSVTAARAPLLAARLYRERPSSGRESAVADQLSVLQTAFGLPGSSLDGSMADFYNSFSALAADPTSITARQQVVARGSALALDFNQMAQQLQASAHDADTGVRSNLDQVNTLAAQIASINKSIGSSGGVGPDVETLRDQQLAAVQTLSSLIDVDVVNRSDGGLDVSVGNGRALVVGDNVYALSAVTPGPTNAARIVSGSTDITSEITGGRLGGLIQVRDVLVPGYAARLDALAYGVANDVNTAHTGGYDLNGTAGTNFFTPPAGVAGAAAALTMNAAVVADPRLVAAAGAPTAGDNQVAKAIANLQDQVMTGTSAKPSEAWGDLVFRVGADTKTATTNRDTHDEVVKQIQQLNDQITGVSLDEEAAMMMQFQRAYEANARFFSAADEALTVLLGMVAR